MKLNINRKDVERAVYVLLIILLVLYGMKDSDAAERLIRSVADAFTILLNTPWPVLKISF